jgi:hypothetical protein
MPSFPSIEPSRSGMYNLFYKWAKILIEIVEHAKNLGKETLTEQKVNLTFNTCRANKSLFFSRGIFKNSSRAILNDLAGQK